MRKLLQMKGAVPLLVLGAIEELQASQKLIEPSSFKQLGKYIAELLVSSLPE